ncbi:MAG: hypothetical protein RIQ82_1094, partial [Bacteroidota bacterium]
MKITLTKLIFIFALSLITGCKNEPSTKLVDRGTPNLAEALKDKQTHSFEKGDTPKNVILVIG